MTALELPILPRAKVKELVAGKAKLVGSRLDAQKPRGFLSPIEPRLRMGIPYDDLKAVEDEYLSKRSLKSDVGILARTTLAWMLSPSEKAAAVRKPFVVSAKVDNISINEALAAILDKPLPDRARLAFFVHAHALNQARFNRDYADILAKADLLLPDGIGIRLAGRMMGVALRHNINGTDLFPILCREAAKQGLPVVLIGGAPGIADACAQRMKKEIEGLDMPIVTSGFFENDDAARAVVEKVRALGRSLVLVGMGSPRQEQWAWKFLRDVAGATVLTVGGLFDFYSGRMPRAPMILRETGLEWAFRLAQEPRRLAKRYLFGNPLFLALAVEQRLRGRPA